MATISKMTGSNGYYGNSGNGEYGSSGVNHLYVGKSSGTSDYRSRLTFPAMSSLAEVGTDRIRITKMTLYLRRNESGSATTITVGCSSSSAWGAAIDASANGAISTNTGDYQAVDISALADKVTEYGSKWYLHISGKTPRVRFDGTGKERKPYIEVTWERVAATITSNKDVVEIGQNVAFIITPEVEGESHSLTYALGDQTGTITTKNSNNSIYWNVPMELATEILYDTTAPVEIRMTAYDSAGNVQRTETYYQTVLVPDFIKPVFTDLGIFSVNSLNGYLLAGLTTLKIAPVIDMTGTYGAAIQSLSAEISGGQRIEWTSLTESEPGIFTAQTAQTNPLPEGTGSMVITVTDSRGYKTETTVKYDVLPYSLPEISYFNVYRYEPMLNDDEEVVGYLQSDVGDYIAVSLLAEGVSMKPEGTQLNSLSYTIVGENNDTGETITGEAVKNAFLDDDGRQADSGRRIQVIFGMDIFPQKFDGDESWTFTATVTDAAGGKAVQYSVVAPGHAALSISPDKHGTAVGMIATGTKEKPKFEVAEKYESHFYGPAFDRHDTEILGAKVVASAESISLPTASGEATTQYVYGNSLTGFKPGLYLVGAHAAWGPGSGSTRAFSITKDGSNISLTMTPPVSGSITVQNVFAIVQVAEGETVRLSMMQNSGVDVNVTVNYTVARIGG